MEIGEIRKLDIDDFKDKLPVELILEAKINEIISHLNKKLYSEVRRLRFEVKILKEKVSELDNSQLN